MFLFSFLFIVLSLFNSTNSHFAIVRKLKMCTLQEYDVPKEILSIERNKHLLGGTKPKEIASKLEQSTSTMDKSIKRGYKNAFTKMLQFEEAAQSQYVIQFNVNEIRLKRSDSDSEREFCIKHEVRQGTRCDFLCCMKCISDTILFSSSSSLSLPRH